MIIGYARVSSKEQNLDRQIQELENFGCEKIFTEKQSGKNFKERNVYHEMRSKLRFGDVLVVHDLSRFGRNKEEIRDEWKSLMEEGYFCTTPRKGPFRGPTNKTRKTYAKQNST